MEAETNELDAEGGEQTKGAGSNALTGLSVMIGRKRINLKIVGKTEDNARVPDYVRTGVADDSEMYSNPQSGPSRRPTRKSTGRTSGRSYSDRTPAVSHDSEVLCMFCGCCFESAVELADHEPQCAAGETDGGNISCHCGRTFINIDALDNHQSLHEAEAPNTGDQFQCRYCEKVFITSLGLATHEAAHSEKRPLRCSFCNKAFLKKIELVMHERFHSGETPYSCNYCEKRFSTKAKLVKHEVQHTGETPYTCSYCGKTFNHQQTLSKHERTHTGEKPHQCPICTKCFSAQSNYDIHMKLHASGRRFFCSFCGKWFRTEHQMLDHQQNCLQQMNGQQNHNGKPLRYQCSYCEKMFHYKRDKLIHERTHTGERPYSCGYCGKGFTQSQALTIHIRTHTGERPYTCGLCGTDFRDSSSLRKHEFLRHPSVKSYDFPQQTAGRYDEALEDEMYA